MNTEVAIYSCTKIPSTPEEIKEIEDRITDPYTLTGKDRLRALYKMQGLEFDENIFEKIIEEYHLDEL